jgi:hypothetical protein
MKMKQTDTHTHTQKKKAMDFFFCCREKRIFVCLSCMCVRILIRGYIYCVCLVCVNESRRKLARPGGSADERRKEKMLRALFAADSVESQHDGCHPVQHNFN